MKKLLFLLLITLVILSCQTKKRDYTAKQEENIRAYVTNHFSEYYPTFASLDSLRIMRTDTVTDKIRLILQWAELNDSREHYDELFNLRIKKAEYYSDLAKLMGTSSYRKHYINRGNEELEQAEGYSHSISRLKSSMDSIMDLHKKADSTTAIAYEAVCAYQFRGKDMTVERGILPVLLNLNKDIITRKELLK